MLREGIASSFEEHGIPELYSATPDLDQADVRSVKSGLVDFFFESAPRVFWVALKGSLGGTGGKNNYVAFALVPFLFGWL